MKRNYILFIFILIASLSHAQTNVTKELILTLDSVYSDTIDKFIYTYYSNALLHSEEEYYWDVNTSSWTKNTKNEYEYDANGNVIIHINYNGGNTWHYSYKIETTYNPNGNIDYEITYHWNSTFNNWGLYSKTENFYDSNNNLDSIISYNWNNSTWINNNKYEYNFTNGQITLEKAYIWDNSSNQWIPTGKAEYGYDTFWHITSETYWHWESTINDWMPDYKLEYTYNTNGDSILEIDYQWNSSNNSWEQIYKLENEYDSESHIIKTTGYTWDNEQNTWINESKREFSYDTCNNQISKTSYYWDSDNNLWKESKKAEYYYDNTVPANQIVTNNNYQTTYNYKIDSIAEFNWDNSIGDWSDNPFVFRYYYAMENYNYYSYMPNEELQIYPNPTKDYLIIKNANIVQGEKFELFSSNGQKVFEQKIYGKMIYFNNIRSGIYFYKIGKFNGKIIIQ